MKKRRNIKNKKRVKANYLIEENINYIEKYVNMIKNNEIKANKEIEVVYSKLLKDIEYYSALNDKKYFYDNNEALRCINFIQNYCVVKGGKKGQKMRLMTFQKALASAIFGFRKIDEMGNSIRKFELISYIIGRKNGKTYFSACVLLYLILTEKLETCREIYSIGNDLSQSKRIWDDLLYIVNNNNELKSRFELRKSTNTIEQIDDNCNFRPLSSNTHNMDGLRGAGVIFDELHEFSDKKNGGSFNLLKRATANAKTPLMFICSTFGYVRDNVFDNEMLTWKYIIKKMEMGEPLKDSEEKILPVIYKLDKEEELYPTEGEDLTLFEKYGNWQKPNPGISFVDINAKKGAIKKLSFLIDEYNNLSVRGDKSHFRDMLIKDFNIIQSNREAFLGYEEIENLTFFDLEEIQKTEDRFKYGFAGIDLSRVGDLTALVFMLKRKNDPKLYLVPFFYIPKATYLKKKEETIFPYETWYNKNYLHLCGEDIIDTREIVNAIEKFTKTYKITLIEISYDRWSASELIIKLQERFGKNITRAIAMDKKTLTEPIERLMIQLRSKEVVYNDHQLLKFCFMNSQLEYSKDGKFFQIVKDNAEEKIDGTISTICCIDSYIMHKDKYRNYIE